MASVDEGFTHAEEVLADGDLVGPDSADPVLSQTDPDPITSKELKEEAEEGNENKVKATLLISGAVVALLGAIFAVVKKTKKEA